MEFSLGQLSGIAQHILAEVAQRASSDHATIVAFSGDLGAGKTTMIKEMARILGVQDDLASPTFVIYKIYKIAPTPQLSAPSDSADVSSPRAGEQTAPWKNLVHGDMYRLESSQEILDLGWEQLINDPENLIVIEWPEKIADVIPSWAGRVELRHVDGDKRELDFR